ncbi:MAG: hypothetical protein AB1598_06280 [Thermodesulfobacteriota bacterium]
MTDKKQTTPSAADKPAGRCPEECIIGLDECAECGVCGHCADGAHLIEDELPSHWQKFIEKSKKTP